MRKALVITILMVLSLTMGMVHAQDQIAKEIIDSLVIDDHYSVGKYELTGMKGIARGNKAQQLIFYLDGAPTMYTASKNLELYDFNGGEKASKPDYARDINGDGLEEIIIQGHTGLGGCCNHIAFHTLGKAAIQDLGTFDLQEFDEFELKDIDNDSIPELIFQDPHYLKWNAPFSESPRPTVIYKWDNGKYRGANFKFSDYLLKQIDKNAIKDLEKAIKRRVEKEYDPDHEYYKYPPARLWGLMLDYIYANKKDKAETILMQYWPDEIPGKDLFYVQFLVNFKKSDYWPDIEKSEW